MSSIDLTKNKTRREWVHDTKFSGEKFGSCLSDFGISRVLFI